MKLCMLGTGYVGLVSGVCFSDLGNDVICVDRDKKKISDLKKGIIPIYEPGLEELVLKNYNNKRLKFSIDLKDSISKSDIVFICVGTPTKKNSNGADLSQIYNVAKEIRGSISKFKIIITKSTVPVSTGDDLEKIMSKDSDSLRKHIALHFHKFLSGPSAIKIFINNVVIMPIDPFFKNKQGYQEGKIEDHHEFVDTARSKSGSITVKAHIIPHHDFMTAEEIDRHGGLENIHKDQGLYIYREKRLIMYGGWMGLKPKFTVARLARVEVEVSSNFDEEWSTNVMKTSLQLPSRIKNMIKKLIQTPIARSKREYTYRGNIEEEDKFWSVQTNDRDQTIAYIVNKDNMMLAEILKDLSDSNKILMLKYLKDMCEHLPINSILQRMSSDPKSVNQEIEDSFFDIDKLKKMLNS